ncbi:NUDIX domain-containing protein [Nocardia yamanashiensis]|uniref:NUDIX domain-containing protein n=1 Tax=Nocardia yamanashiensis TaxID=209247 RepID=UPI000AA1E378|nr:NUDIX hydrolase [Nocardia yamanashiensis]
MGNETTDLIANLPRKRMGAGVLFVDDEGRVLLVEPTYKDYWEIPGGVVEAEESPAAAAVREIREELGLEIELGRLLVTDWVPSGIYPGDGVMVVFDGGVLSAERAAAIVLPADELRSWAWCDANEIKRLLPAALARRVSGALRARREGIAVYSEDGYVIG